MKYFYLICLLFLHFFGTEIQSLSILSKKPKPAPLSLLGSSSSKKPSARGGLLSPLSTLLTKPLSKTDVDDDLSETKVKDSIIPVLPVASNDKPTTVKNSITPVAVQPSAASTGGLLSPLSKLLTKSPSKPDVDDDLSATKVKDSITPALPVAINDKPTTVKNSITPVVPVTVQASAAATGGLLSPLSTLLTKPLSKTDVDDDLSETKVRDSIIPVLPVASNDKPITVKNSITPVAVQPSAASTDGLLSHLSKLLTKSPSKPDVDDDLSATKVKDSITPALPVAINDKPATVKNTITPVVPVTVQASAAATGGLLSPPPKLLTKSPSKPDVDDDLSATKVKYSITPALPVALNDKPTTVKNSITPVVPVTVQASAAATGGLLSPPPKLLTKSPSKPDVDDDLSATKVKDSITPALPVALNDKPTTVKNSITPVFPVTVQASAAATGGLLSPPPKLLTKSPSKPDVDDDLSATPALPVALNDKPTTVKNSITPIVPVAVQPLATEAGGLLSSLSNSLKITPPKSYDNLLTTKDSITPESRVTLTDKSIIPSVPRSTVKSESYIQHVVSSTSDIESTDSLAKDQEAKLSPLEKSDDPVFKPYETTIVQSAPEVNIETKSPLVSQGEELSEYHLKDVKHQDTVPLKPEKESIFVKVPLIDNIVALTSVVEPTIIKTVLEDVGQQNRGLQEKAENVDKQHVDQQAGQLQSVVTEQNIKQLQEVEFSKGDKLQDTLLQNVEPLDTDLRNVRVENVDMKGDAVEAGTEKLPLIIDLASKIVSKVPVVLDTDFIDPTVADSASKVAGGIEISATDVLPIISSVPELVHNDKSDAETVAIPTDIGPVTSSLSDDKVLKEDAESLISTVPLATSMQPASSLGSGSITSFVTHPEATIPEVQNVDVIPLPDIAFSDASMPNDYSASPNVGVTSPSLPDIDMSTPLTKNLHSSETPDILLVSRNISSSVDLTELSGITNLVSTLSGGLKNVLSNLTNALTSTHGLKDVIIYLLSILQAILTLFSRMNGVPQADKIISSLSVLNPLIDGLLYLPEIFSGVLRNFVSSSSESLIRLSILQVNGLTGLLNLVLNFLNYILSAIPHLLGGIPLDTILSGLQEYIGTLERILPNMRINSSKWQYQTFTKGNFQNRSGGPVDISGREINLITIYI